MKNHSVSMATLEKKGFPSSLEPRLTSIHGSKHIRMAGYSRGKECQFFMSEFESLICHFLLFVWSFSQLNRLPFHMYTSSLLNISLLGRCTEEEIFSFFSGQLAKADVYVYQTTKFLIVGAYVTFLRWVL